MTRSIPATIALLACAATMATAQAPETATAELLDRDGNRAGEVRLTQTPHGVLLHVEAEGLEPGTYAIHIHETGRCDPPTFESAGGHFNPGDRAHGILHPEGMHGGDLLNLHVPAGGRIEAERHAPHVTLEAGMPASLLDGDGTAVVVHVAADDYESQPTGDAGDRLLCGVIRGGSLGDGS